MSARDAVPLHSLSTPDACLAPDDGSLPMPSAVCLGRLVGFTDEGRTPLVVGPDTGAVAARPARAAVDLHGAHVGRSVVLMWDPARPGPPIVLAVLRDEGGWPLRERIGQVEVSADGERMTISAREQLVLRCGKASITLRSDGRIDVHGDTIVTQAVRANHVRGGSVQLN